MHIIHTYTYTQLLLILRSLIIGTYLKIFITWLWIHSIDKIKDVTIMIVIEAT